MKLGKTKLIGIVAFVALVVGASFGILLGSTFNKEEASFEDDTSKPKQIVNENTLSMMIEQTAGAGDYKLETRSSWPTEGYKFNATLSKCENGGELGWDETKGVITMTGNMSDKCYIYFDKYSYGVVNSFTYTATASSLTITASATKGENEISTYYFSIDNGSTYKESSTNTYTFSGLTKGTTYTIKIKVKDSLDKESSVYSGTATTENAVYFADYIKSLYTGTQGENGLYYHNSSLANGAGDNSYRYAGASDSVDNYVCLYSSCNNSYTYRGLFRIIGVFGNQVKLISSKKYVVPGLEWDSNGSNTWSTSSLNTYLYEKTFLSGMRNTIAYTTWKVGGNIPANISDATPKTAYANEITNPVTTNSTDNATTYSAMVGLMYVSDYGFAADPSAWSTTMRSYNSYNSVNWMYYGYAAFTITRNANDASSVFGLDSEGSVIYWDASYTYDEDGDGADFYLFPTVYLYSGVTYYSGTGKISDPYIIREVGG